MGEVSLKIEVPREKAEELYRFTDMYVYPKKFMTWSEYVWMIDMWNYDVIDLVFRDMCDAVFELEEEEECPVDREKILDELFDILEGNEELKKLGEKVGLTWDNIEDRDDHIVVDKKIEIYPTLKVEEDGYKIYLVVYMK
ncbi:MAG: hypothetical protein QXT73_07400 [Candidatus Methanomethylicaceae archaeon]